MKGLKKNTIYASQRVGFINDLKCLELTIDDIKGNVGYVTPDGRKVDPKFLAIAKSKGRY